MHCGSSAALENAKARWTDDHVVLVLHLQEATDWRTSSTHFMRSAVWTFSTSPKKNMKLFMQRKRIITHQAREAEPHPVLWTQLSQPGPCLVDAVFIHLPCLLQGHSPDRPCNLTHASCTSPLRPLLLCPVLLSAGPPAAAGHQQARGRPDTQARGEPGTRPGPAIRAHAEVSQTQQSTQWMDPRAFKAGA